eukprot:359920-Chlamydomonas_euryale.AAC.12
MDRCSSRSRGVKALSMKTALEVGASHGCLNTDAAIARLWQTVWDLREGVLGCREYRSTSRDTLSCPAWSQGP